MERPRTLSSLAARELRRASQWENEFGHIGPQEKVWKVLLQLYLTNLDGDLGLTVKSLWLYSGLPETTALRTFKLLEKQGHLQKIRNPEDSRSFLITLSSDLASRIEHYLETVARNRENRQARSEN